MSPVLMQAVVGIVYIFYIPIAFKMNGEALSNFKWSGYSLVLTSLATILSIFANVLLYMFLKGNNSSGTSTMFIALYPVVTLLLTVFFLHEQISPLKICGIVSMIFGAILLSIK
jgi:drug/metabolite transporter (DMT)-like permease